MKAKIIGALIAFTLSVLAELIPNIFEKIRESKMKKKANKKYKMEEMERDPIDVEWRFA